MILKMSPCIRELKHGLMTYSVASRKIGFTRTELFFNSFSQSYTKELSGSVMSKKVYKKSSALLTYLSVSCSITKRI
jgi:hypothetical protein